MNHGGLRMRRRSPDPLVRTTSLAISSNRHVWTKGSRLRVSGSYCRPVLQINQVRSGHPADVHDLDTIRSIHIRFPDDRPILTKRGRPQGRVESVHTEPTRERNRLAVREFLQSLERRRNCHLKAASRDQSIRKRERRGTRDRSPPLEQHRRCLLGARPVGNLWNCCREAPGRRASHEWNQRLRMSSSAE